jgi:hypothetical protein
MFYNNAGENQNKNQVDDKVRKISRFKNSNGTKHIIY